MDFNQFATDEKAEIEGRWFPIGDSQVLIARTGNPKYRDLVRKKLRSYVTSLKMGMLDENVQESVMVEIIARTILLDWKGFTKGGEPYAYTVAAAQEMLGKFKDFREFVVTNADDMQNYKAESAAATMGNSQPESNGTSDGAKT